MTALTVSQYCTVFQGCRYITWVFFSSSSQHYIYIFFFKYILCTEKLFCFCVFYAPSRQNWFCTNGQKIFIFILDVYCTFFFFFYFNLIAGDESVSQRESYILQVSGLILKHRTFPLANEWGIFMLHFSTSNMVAMSTYGVVVKAASIQ